MAIIKCKMCGGDIELSADKTFGTCDSCGSTMTFPKVDDDQRAAAFNRGNHFRRIGEFDKALAVYERIVQEDDADAEAHWCCALCRFGIEYVEDPATYEWLPTCHRASFDSFLEDVDYLAAVEHSDGITRRQYQKDAARIAEVQKGILATSQSEEPFDIFICYKESDENGDRTRDSILAQDIYYQLTEQGRRVFFARITLEDKAGAQYEPYIFAALHSARVMVVVGTKPEHFNAVWVKNEWSRFLALMRKDHAKLLLPCYRDMDPYDLPEQLSVLQSYDMSKIGFVQDLTRGIAKVLDAQRPAEPVRETVVVQQGNSNLTALLKRGNMALEDGEWESAGGYYDRALDLDAECAEAYVGKYLVEKRTSSLEKLIEGVNALEVKKEWREAVEVNRARVRAAVERYALVGYLAGWQIEQVYDFNRSYLSALTHSKNQCAQKKQDYDADKNMSKALRFASGDYKAKLDGLRKQYFERLEARVEKARAEDEAGIAKVKAAYEAHLNEADAKMVELRKQAEERCEEDRKRAEKKHEEDRKRAERLREEQRKLEEQKRQEQYQEICQRQEKAVTEWNFKAVLDDFLKMGDYADCAERAKQCQQKIVAIQKAERMAAEKEERKGKRRERITKIIACVLVVGLAASPVVTKVLIPLNHYKTAEKLLAAGDYDGAITEFVAAGDYKDAADRIPEVSYAHAEALLAAGDFDGAIAEFGAAVGYRDATERILSVHYARAEALLAAGDNDGAIAEFLAAGEYQDAAERILGIHYAQAETLLAAGDYDGAIEEFEAAGEYQDAAERILKIHYARAEALLAAGDNDGAIEEFEAAGEYQDAAERILTTHYAHAEMLLADGHKAAAAMAFGMAKSYQDARKQSTELWNEIAERNMISAGFGHTVGLKSDSTVVAAGWNDDGQCNVSDWRGIVAVSTSGGHAVGLKADGTVVAVGSNYHGQSDVSDWTDIVAVSAGMWNTVGLKSDGTVVAVGDNDYSQCNVSDWTDIVAISTGCGHTVSLKADGTVVAVGDNDYSQCNVSDWMDIVAISAGSSHTAGLKADGTVVAVGDNDYSQCNVSDWTDIVAVSAGDSHTVGLKSDGTVVAAGWNDDGQCDVSDWVDIVAVSAGMHHTVGLKADGTVVVAGDNDYGECDVSSWKLF